VLGSERVKWGYGEMQFMLVGCVCFVYGVRDMGEEVSSRRVGGRTKDRIVLSALEVKRVVPSGDLAVVRICSSRALTTHHCALLK
jgi:hypothetical protein